MALIERRFDAPSFHPGVVLKKINNRIAVRRTRKALARLDAHLLRDIGLSVEEARREAERGLWDTPVDWQR